MKVLITSTPAELTRHVAHAAEVIEAMGWEARVSDPAGAATVDEGLAPVARADLVLALIGWRRGPVPGPVAGWNGSAPWGELEARRAFALAKPVLVMMAGDDWPQRETSPRARAQVADFRAEVEGLALLLRPENDPAAPVFRSLLEAELVSYLDRSSAPPSETTRHRSGLELRRWPAPEYPRRPWPVLLPYAHPELLCGRERDREELLRLLARQQPILGLHAASGVGKSSLLAGGVAPKLRAEGRPTAFDRHPDEPGLAARLVGDLLAGPAGELALEDGDVRGFVELVRLAGRRASAPPVLILDQVEDVLHGGRSARARLGMLMAATVQRRSWIHGAPCRWLLAYRREAHGEIVRWLEDVLREARALGMADSDRLPHNLALHDRFQVWPLAVLGTPRRSRDDAETSAVQAFEAVLTAPLALRIADGEPRYPWRFAGGGASRLARAFAAARLRDPEAPLVPELQVVLSDLVAAASPSSAGRPALLEVPEAPGELIDGALDRHLVRVFDAIFAPGDRVGRTRALLALYELAHHEGRRHSGRASRSARKSDELIRAIGHQGREVFARLQAPDARLVIANLVDGETVYMLSHDRLAEVIIAAVEGQGSLAVAPELLDLRRFVALSSELYHSGERATSTLVSRAQIAAVEEHADCLLPDPRRRAWWRACRIRYRRGLGGRIALWSLAVALLVAGAWLTWSRLAAQAAREAILEQIALGDPEVAFQALGQSLADPEIPPEMTLARLQSRASPLDVLTSGMAGVARGRRIRTVLEAAELVLPWVAMEDSRSTMLDVPREHPPPEESGLASPGQERVVMGDPRSPMRNVLLASLIWALDYGPGRAPEQRGRALELRDRALAPLRRRRPPPAIAGDATWVAIPAGSFRMGSEAGSGGAEDTQPAHKVTLDAFLMLDHEVTNAEYRRLFAAHPGADDLPATGMSWYDATVYAAWLGGRLPTEAEWEYAALGGCDVEFCLADGSAAQADDVAWTTSNATDPATDEAVAQPVRRLAANPFGLYDVYGNVWEWAADWYRPYSGGPQTNPWGASSGHERAFRGAAYWTLAERLSARDRVGLAPHRSYPSLGFRVVLLAPGAS